MKALIMQTSYPYPTVEEAEDALAGVQVIEGYIFGYVNVKESRHVSFHDTDPQLNVDEVKAGQSQPFRNQEHVLVRDDESDLIRMRIAKE